MLQPVLGYFLPLSENSNLIPWISRPEGTAVTSQADPLHSAALAETPLLVLKPKHIFEKDPQSP